MFERLPVASMACVPAWEVGRSVHPRADHLRATLIELSGRQMKYGVDHTGPALLAGLWVVFRSLAVLELFGPETLGDSVRGVLLGPESGPPPPAEMKPV